MFKVELEKIIDPNHALVKLANGIDWTVFERAVEAEFSGSLGRPALPTRLVAGLFYLELMFDLREEALEDAWLQNLFIGNIFSETFIYSTTVQSSLLLGILKRASSWSQLLARDARERSQPTRFWRSLQDAQALESLLYLFCFAHSNSVSYQKNY